MRDAVDREAYEAALLDGDPVPDFRVGGAI